jgi:hypothetical protein
MKEFKYTTIFSSEIKPLVSEDKDKYLAMASLVDVGEFIPDLDIDSNYDLLPIAFNACVINRVNKNDDVVDTEHGIAMAKHFINKPINVEHNRERVVGTILTAGYSEFGTDKPLTEEEVKDLKGPFNITLGGVIWKVVNSHLAEIIENASDPTSEDYLRVSASWELGFTEYNIAVAKEDEKNIENATIITDNEKVDELKDILRGFGGEGSLETGERIYRHVIGEIVPLGIGLTETPAAEVKGVAVKTEKEEEVKAETETPETPEPAENAEKVSHFEEKNVIENKDTSIMKITNINDITDESVKQLSASAVSDFISDEIQKVSDQFEAEKTQREEVLKNTQEKFDQVADNLESVKAELDKMKQEKAEHEALELFNQRMAAFDEEYELNDQIRAHVASDIKDMNEEDFNGYKDKMTAFLSGYDKKTIAAEKAKAETEAAEAAKEVEETAAKEESQEETVEEVVEQAVDNAEEVEQQATPNTTEASDASLYDKYKDAFSIDNFNIKL